MDRITANIAWLLLALTAIAATVGVGYFVGRPEPSGLDPTKAGAASEGDGLDFDRIEQTIREFTQTPSRVTGQPGCEQTAKAIIKQLEGLGKHVEIQVQSFDVAVPVTEEDDPDSAQGRKHPATLETADGSRSLRLYPLWPNLARTAQTPPNGLTGPLVSIGGGREQDMAGKKINGSIVVIDWACDIEWLSVPEFGGKAVIFRANDAATGSTARNKFLSMPANIPRYYVAKEDEKALDAMLAADSTEVIVRCRTRWKQVTTSNILAKVSAGTISTDRDAKEIDKAPVIFHAYYDSISVVPERSPGAEQAVGPAVLLDMARYFASHPTRRPVYVLFTGGHGQTISGMTHFVDRLRKGPADGWTEDETGSLLAKMGTPGLFVGLDLSTHSDQFGVFCLGNFRGQTAWELKHRFAGIGKDLADYDAACRIDEDADEDARAEAAKIRPRFIDGINMADGRTLSSYFCYSTAFASEVPTLGGFPGITFATVNDAREKVDTPGDRFGNLDLPLLKRQISAKANRHVGLLGLAEALTTRQGPFVQKGVSPHWAELGGRVVWLDQMKNYTPDEPLARVMAFAKKGLGDKHLVGTRGIPAVMTDTTGRFLFTGQYRWSLPSAVEAFGTADKSFLDANVDAAKQYTEVMPAVEGADQGIEADGSIIFAVDMARPGEYPWKTPMRATSQAVNVVCFPCRALTVMGLTDPRGYIPLNDLTVLDTATKAPPFQYGQSRTDNTLGDDKESMVTFWADPSMRVLLTLGLGFEGKRLVLINNSLDNPEGDGFVLSELATVPSMVLQGSLDMWRLNETRIAKLTRNGVKNPRTTAQHKEAEEHLKQAKEALDANDYRAYRLHSAKGWAIEGKVYSEVLSTINDMIHGVLFYLALLLPLSYCLERLLVASKTIKGRLTWIMVIFSVCFAVLATAHPAFRFTLTPLLVLLAFIILALVTTVSVLIVGRVDTMLREQKQVAIGRHEDDTRKAGVAIRAVDLGIANIRRRPRRGILTGLTVVTVTFILLSFTSLTPTVSISRLTHPDGQTTYKGLLIRDRAWEPLPDPLYDATRRNFEAEANAASQPAAPDANADGADPVVAARAWFFSDKTGEISKIDVIATDVADDAEPEGFTADALLCMEATEPKITGVDKTLVDGAGKWFTEEDETEPGVIVSQNAAKLLGYSLDDVRKSFAKDGKPLHIRVFGRKLPLRALYDGAKFDDLLDIDGEPLTPANFVRQQQTLAAEAQAGAPDPVTDTLQEYVHYSSDNLVIVPLKFARRLGATIRSIAIKGGTDTDVTAEAEGYAKRSNLTILAADGDAVTLYAALDTSQLSAAWQIVIPVFLGFVMIMGTMLGSVYERHSEIFVYSSVGLSPRNVSSLFLAESTVYAVIGAGMGYLLGQVVTKVLQATGMLAGLSLNYTAGATVLVTVVTMVIVILSAIYPARKAYHAAIPDADEEADELDGGEMSQDALSMYLPFVATSDNILGMQEYMREFLDSIQGVTVGKLAVESLRAGMGQVEGKDQPVLTFRAWAAPFDLDVSYEAELALQYRPDRDIYQYHLRATRFSGDRQNWRRLAPQFILGLRKQLLMWRVLSANEVDAYRQRGAKLFGKADDGQK